MDFEPELGQMAFGQPSQQLECPEIVDAALVLFSYFWPDNDTPFSNSGIRYEGEKFSIHGYSWNDEEEQPYNFKWRDIEVSWYKYLGRSMSINREVSVAEVKEMVLEFLEEIK